MRVPRALLSFTTVPLFLAMLRVVNSPFCRVLQAILENDFRAVAIGDKIVVLRTLSKVLAAILATLTGCMIAIWPMSIIGKLPTWRT